MTYMQDKPHKKPETTAEFVERLNSNKKVGKRNGLRRMSAQKKRNH